MRSTEFEPVVVARSAGYLGAFCLALVFLSFPAHAQDTPHGTPSGEVPVGTILPFIGAAEALPEHWALCDGRTVTDPDSPLRGTVLPDLTDDRFLMGVGSADSVGTSGGDNTLSPDGAHGHVGSSAGRPNQQSGTPRHLNSRGDRGFQHSHDLSIRQDGAHTHGGDNRPRFFGVRFIIRVK